MIKTEYKIYVDIEASPERSARESVKLAILKGIAHLSEQINPGHEYSDNNLSINLEVDKRKSVVMLSYSGE